MKTAAEILADERKFIEDPDGWTRGALARDANGRQVATQSPNAVSFCAVGACRKAVHNAGYDNVFLYDGYYAVRDTLDECTEFFDVINMNDRYDTTHEDVLKAFDCAIKKAKEREVA